LKFLVLCAPLLLLAPDGLAKSGKKRGGKKGKGAEAAATYVPPYGMAGCGLGSLVFKEDTKVAQITAATLNGTGVQTSAISSTHSSGCKEQAGEAALRVEQEVFVAANLRALEEDVTAGGGDFTQAFAQVLGCEDEASYGELLTTSRANYDRIFTSDDAQVVYSQYMAALRANPALTVRCARVVAKS
jgi:hypothetical protein